MHPAPQRVGYEIVLALVVVDEERVVLKVLHPSCMSAAQLLLRVEVLKGFVVQKEHELLGQGVVAPVPRRLNDDIDLLIVCRVSESNIIQLFAEELDVWPSWLRTPPMPMLEASHMNSNTLLKSGNRKTCDWVIRAFSM